MKNYIVLPISLLLFIPFISGWSWSTDSSNAVKLSGNIEVTEVALSFRIPGVVANRFVDEGVTVKKGQLIAELASETESLSVSRAQSQLAIAQERYNKMKAGSRKEEIERAKAAFESAKFNLQQLEKGPRIQEKKSAKELVKQAKSSIKKAKAQYDLAKSDYKRFSALFSSGTIGAKEFQNYKTAFQVAKQALSSARARLKESELKLNLMIEGTRKEQIEMGEAALDRAKAQYELVKKGPRIEDVKASEAALKVAKANLEIAKLNLGYTKLFSPISGTVLSKGTEAGEYAFPGKTIVTVANLDRVWVRGYISETKIGQIKLGDKVKVTVDSYPNETFTGTIGFISQEAEFTPKVVQTFEERVKLMYRVKIYISNPDHKLKPGMPADVTKE